MHIGTSKILKPTNIEKVTSAEEPYDLEKISAAQDCGNMTLMNKMITIPRKFPAILTDHMIT